MEIITGVERHRRWRREEELKTAAPAERRAGVAGQWAHRHAQQRGTIGPLNVERVALRTPQITSESRHWENLAGQSRQLVHIRKDLHYGGLSARKRGWHMGEETIDGSVRARIEAVLPEIVAIRRDIHARPELGREERRTSALVAQKLREWGIEVAEQMGGFGVVGTLRGKRPGQGAIGLRADMDALALIEQTSLPYASTNAGRMHACGHDGHTAMLLGAAKVLAEDLDFAGTVQLIFQPAEEGLGGAQAMLRDGLFERFPCDAVYGMHNMPGIPVGRIALRKGPVHGRVGPLEGAVFRHRRARRQFGPSRP
jgi:hypothetical protein